MIDVSLTISAQSAERTVCAANGVSRSTLRRICIGSIPSKMYKPRQPRNALSTAERTAVRDALNSDRFADLAAPQVFTQMLDENVYLCSLRTMYRLLRANDQVRERRRSARHPEYHTPELVATALRHVLTWDITKIRGPAKGVWYSLLVMIDIFSRYTVGSDRKSVV